MAALMAGCSHLQVATDPPSSLVAIKDPNGKAVASGEAPLIGKVSFSGADSAYSIEVQPPPGMTDRYLPLRTNISRTAFGNLPPYDGEKNRRLNVKLEGKLFVTFPYVEVILDAQHTWRGAVIHSRAYKDVSEVGGAVPTRIVDFGENAAIQSLALSPDGNRIIYSVASYPLSNEDLQRVFAASGASTIEIAGANLNAVSISAGGIEHITSENFRDMSPSFTPDGQKLLFSSNRRRAGSEDILMINAQRRSGISDVYVHREARTLRPTQAEDGTIAFCAEESNPVDLRQRFTIWTLGGPNQFPTQIQIGSQPAISPDGKHIAYIGPDGNLWVVNSDGTQATQLTFGADKILERYKASLDPEEAARYQGFIVKFGFAEKMAFSFPSWSKDGHKIAYTGMEGSDSTGRPNEDIWMMEVDGSNKRQLTTNGSIDRYPLISPDSRWIYFMSNRGGRWAIWRVPAQEATATAATR